jgi:uncharacterized membrane protein HdeD (DUF308 family)
MAEATWMDEAKKNAGLLIFLGILTVIFGVLAIAAPFITGVAVAIFVGSLLVLTGIAQLVHAFKARMWGIGFWGSVIGLLSIAAGVYMMIRPGVGLAALTLLLAIYFLVDGISEIIAAFRIKPDQGWGWVLFNGIIAVLLGLMIWRQWPVSGAWAIGVLVGIHILITGWSMIILGTGARRITGWSMIILGTGARRVAGAIEDAVEDAVDTAGDVAEKVADVAEDAVDTAKDFAGDVTDKAEDVVDDVVDKAKDTFGGDKN